MELPGVISETFFRGIPTIRGAQLISELKA
jgi:hypothetical protein